MRRAAAAEEIHEKLPVIDSERGRQGGGHRRIAYPVRCQAVDLGNGQAGVFERRRDRA